MKRNYELLTAILGEKEVRFFSHIRSFRMTLRNLFFVIPNEVRNLNAFQIHRELLTFWTFWSLVNTTANFSTEAANQWLLAVIPGLTRNPESIENHGFPIKDFGNDKKYAVVLVERS